MLSILSSREQDILDMLIVFAVMQYIEVCFGVLMVNVQKTLQISLFLETKHFRRL